jgi:hypothetical protein
MRKLIIFLMLFSTINLLAQAGGMKVTRTEHGVGWQAPGRFTANDGLKADATDWGAGLILFTSEGTVFDHKLTNNAGNFDLTGGAYENLFTDTTNDPFVSGDKGNWIIIRSGDYYSAMAVIDEYIDAENVILHTMGWDGDLTSIDYFIIQHPQMAIGDGYHTEFQCDTDGHFDIHSHDWTGSAYTNYLFEVELESGADGTDGALFEAEAEGYSGVNSVVIDYKSGDLQAGDTGGGLGVLVNVNEATSADATTKVDAIVAVAINGSGATTNALRVLPGFTNALQVQGADAVDPDYGYENTGGSSTDRVNGGTADTQAFLSSSASNLEIFDSNGDYILIGSDSKFELVEIILTVNSSKDIDADFFYSKAGGGWTALTVQADGTNGMQQSGFLTFTAPADWTEDDEDMDANAITEAYYIAIERTYNPTIPTLPTENYFKTVASQATGMSIDGNGFILPRVSTDAAAPNGSIYYSTDQSNLVFKDAGGTVRDLY